MTFDYTFYIKLRSCHNNNPDTEQWWLEHIAPDLFPKEYKQYNTWYDNDYKFISIKIDE